MRFDWAYYESMCCQKCGSALATFAFQHRRWCPLYSASGEITPL